ncbi:hypothetical protein R1flu_024161 [Riccia fluitans]|uniref:Uncharacterized protein n=1 Tax=Riccia fluitans TaxID=41844 RepID=A0ABD1XU34_9MARC
MPPTSEPRLQDNVNRGCRTMNAALRMFLSMSPSAALLRIGIQNARRWMPLPQAQESLGLHVLLSVVGDATSCMCAKWHLGSRVTFVRLGKIWRVHRGPLTHRNDSSRALALYPSLCVAFRVSKMEKK